jgi:FkbM family methyltransferase
MERRRALWEKLGKSVTVSWLEGLRIRLFPGNETSHVLFLTGLYEPNEFLWLDRFLAPGMTVIDGGANIGLYTLYAARRVGPAGTVLAIEPSQRDFDRLTEHVRLTRLRNVRCRRLALSRAPGRGQLRVAAEWNAGHNTLGEFGYETTELVRVEEVKVRALDAIVADEGLQRVDLIKLDIEGAEYDALRGAEATIRRFRPAILVELADRTLRHQGAHSGQIWDFLEGRGYTLYGFDANRARLQPAARKPKYDSENLVAVPRVREDRMAATS